MNSTDWRRALKLNEIAESEWRQMQDRSTRRAQIRKAGNRSRLLERERKALLKAERTTILANPQPQLRKARKESA
jgi:hypothetical protein